MMVEENWESEEYPSSTFPTIDDTFVFNETYNYSNWLLDDEEIYIRSPLPWWRQLLWSFLFGSMVIVATVGNLVVIWIVLAHKRMRTVTNYLLVNLSIADTMVSTMNVIPNYIYMSTQHWPFGSIYCKLVQFVAALSICASTFTLMAIAFDRYNAIMNPLKPRMGRRVTLGIAGCIWIGGVVLSLPNLIYFTTFASSSGIVVCYGEWPDGSMTESYHEYLYNVFFMIFTYFVPIVVMGYTYTRVGVELWGSQSIGEATQRQLENIKSKRRVVKMMMVVVSIFAICWFPFQLYFIVVSFAPTITQENFIQEIFLGVYWLAMSNSMYNPIIYCWMNARFRRGFQQVFFWCPFVTQVSEFEGGPTRTICDTRRIGVGGGLAVQGDGCTRYSVTESPEFHTRVTRNGGNTGNTGGTSVHIPLHVLTTCPSSGKSITEISPKNRNGTTSLTSENDMNSPNPTSATTQLSSAGTVNPPLNQTSKLSPGILHQSLCVNRNHRHVINTDDPNGKGDTPLLSQWKDLNET